MPEDSAAKFDAVRANEYARQSRIALAGYDACHELTACMLAAHLGHDRPARILVVGAGGTAGEIIASAKLGPNWDFIAVDPSEPMLELAQRNIAEAGIQTRVQCMLGNVSDIPAQEPFDAAVMIGVLHHLSGAQMKADVLKQISIRLKPGAPFVLAGNYRTYASQPLLMAAWAERWRLHGASSSGIEAKMAKILQGADPPVSEEAVFSLLSAARFEAPLRFFSSLFWGAWVAQRARED